jgi:hypothetical protein
VGIDRLNTFYTGCVTLVKRAYGILLVSRKSSFIFIVVFTAVAVIDSSIVDFSSYSGVEPFGSGNTVIFIIFSIIFVVFSATLLNSVRRSIYTSGPRPLNLTYSHWFISGTVILTVLIILIIIFQMLFLNGYNVVLLSIQTYLSHLSALIFVSLSVYLFARWFTSKRSLTVILYTISLSLLSLNLAVSLTYLESYLSGAPSPIVQPYPIVSYVTNPSGLSNSANVLVG